MTREEAIYCLKSYQPDAPDDMCQKCKYYKSVKLAPNVYTCISDKAREMAIQALSQEPCDDAVSREWLMRKATERFYTTNYFNHISAMIEEAPSVTQKSGKWEDLHRCWACSECGQETHIEHNYCPNCGAKMESEDRTE